MLHPRMDASGASGEHRELVRALGRFGTVCARWLAVGVAAGLNVLGWILWFGGPRQLGLLVLILSVELLGIVLWEAGAGR